MKSVLKWFMLLMGFVFVVLVVAGVAGYFYIKNFDANKYKPQITEQMRQQLGREVEFDDIDLKFSLNEGVRFQLKNLDIKEHTDFGRDSMVRVKSLDAEVALLPFIQSRTVEIPRVVVHDPTIVLIRNADGRLNVQSIPALNPDQAEAGTSTAASSSSSTAASKSTSSSSANISNVNIDSIVIEGATINFIDKASTNSMGTSINQVNLKIDRFALDSPFDVSLDAAVLSNVRNISVSSQVLLKPEQKGAQLSRLRLQVDADHLPLGMLKLIPELKEAPIPNELGGQWVVAIKELHVSDQGLGDLQFDCDVDNGKIVMTEAAPGVSFAIHQLDASIRNFGFNQPFKITSNFGYEHESPNLTINGELSINDKTQQITSSNLSVEADLNSLPMTTIQNKISALKDMAVPETLKGQAKVVIKSLSAGPKGVELLKADLDLQQAAVVMTNVFEGVSVDIQNLDLHVSDYELNQPFDIKMSMGYESAQKNLSVDGRVGFDGARQSTQIENLKIEVKLSDIPMKSVKNKVTALKDVNLPDVLEGTLKMNIRELLNTSKGIDQIDADISLKDGRIEATELIEGVSVALNAIDLSIKNFAFDQLFDVSGNFGYESPTPNISLVGKLLVDPKSQTVKARNFKFDTNLTKIPFEIVKQKIIAAKDITLPDVMTGDVQISVQELVSGAKGVETILADAKLTNSQLTIKEIAPGIAFDANQLNVTINQIQFGKPFDFDINMAYLNDQTNIKASGTAFMDQKSKQVSLTGTQTQIDLSALSLEKIQASLEGLKDVALPKKLQGVLALDVKELRAGPKGLEAINADGILSNWLLEVEQFPQPVSGDQIDFVLRDQDLTIKENTIRVGRGTITNQMIVKKYLTEQDFTASIALLDIDLVEVVDQTKVPNEFQGLVTGQLKASGRLSDVDSIVGEGQLVVADAVVRDINVLSEVIKRISFIPNAAERFKTKLPEDYLQRLEDPDTHIRKAMMNLGFSEQTAILSPLVVESDDFLFSGTCKAGLDQRFSINGDFKLPADLSMAFTQRIDKSFEYFYDDKNQISFPTIASGPPLKISMEQTIKNVIGNAAKKEIGKQLFKALGVETTTAPVPSTEIQAQDSNSSSESVPPVDVQNNPPAEPAPAIEDVIVDTLLDSLFK